MSGTIKIAIDGVAGAGKSTLAKELAGKLNFLHLNTGNIYRALTAECLKKGTDLNSADAVTEALRPVTVDVKYLAGTPVVCINGNKINEKSLHTEKVSNATALVAKIPKIREKVRQVQHSLAEKSNIVMEGRDIGTVVLPDADIKFFLKASPEVRAKRRFGDLPANEQTPENYNQILSGIQQRDREDESRPVSPTKPAKDAITVDTSNNTQERTLEIVKQYVDKKLYSE